jgi:hypothetical protein
MVELYFHSPICFHGMMLNQWSGFSVFLSLLQWNIKFPWTLKFVTAAFSFIISAPFLKCNNSIVCCYKIWNKKPLKDPLSDFTYLYFHFYSHYIKVYIHFLVKFHTFGFILKKSAIVTTDFHFCSDYVISYLCLIHAYSIHAALTGIWCLEMKCNDRSWLTNLSSENTHSQLGWVASFVSSRLVWMNQLNCSSKHRQ